MQLLLFTTIYQTQQEEYSRATASSAKETAGSRTGKSKCVCKERQSTRKSSTAAIEREKEHLTNQKHEQSD